MYSAVCPILLIYIVYVNQAAKQRVCMWCSLRMRSAGGSITGVHHGSSPALVPRMEPIDRGLRGCPTCGCSKEDAGPHGKSDVRHHREQWKCVAENVANPVKAP